MGNPRIVHWTGDLLWPTELPSAKVIDLSGVTALGTWCHDWFRRHPGQTVTGGVQWKDRLLRAGVPVRWRDGDAAVTNANHTGVSTDEREMLWG